MTSHAHWTKTLTVLVLTPTIALTGCTTVDRGNNTSTMTATAPASETPSTTASSPSPHAITEAEIRTCGIANYLQTRHGKVLRAAARDPVGYSLSFATRTDLATIAGELVKQRPAEPLASDSLRLATTLTDGITGDLLFTRPAAQALELISTIEPTCEDLGIPFGRFPKP